MNVRKRLLVLFAASLAAGVAVTTAALAAPSGDDGDRAASGRTYSDTVRGLVYAGLAKDSKNCGPGYRIATLAEGRTVCSHGPDPAPAGKSVKTRVQPVKANDLKTQAVCDGDGTSGYRVQVLYVRASDVGSRFGQYVNSIRTWANQADDIYYQSAVETGGNRRIRFVHDASCVIDVREAVIQPNGDDNFSATTNQLASLGYNRTDRKYMLFVDSNVYCGIGGIMNDDSSSTNNANNRGPSYGRTDSGCWGGNVAAHELNHNLGGVQLSAPNTSNGWHCTDEYDVMCYSDSPDYPQMRYVCTDRAHENRLDCRHDDYYSTNPAAGSYLATHWNSANNRFLIRP
jgi:hypothetical protein